MKTIEVNKYAIDLVSKYFDVFVNEDSEIILDKNKNIFIRGDFENDEDLKIKVIYYLSRCPNDYTLKRYQKEAFLKLNNEVLGKDLSYDDWNLVYKYLGNGINPDLTKRFIASHFDMILLGSTNLF